MSAHLETRLVDAGQAAGAFHIRPEATGQGHLQVTAMMVTRRRPQAALRAIRCFLAQTWENKELVIVDDDSDDSLSRRVGRLGPDAQRKIRHIRLPDSNVPLGELRNIAVSRAAGSLVCQWDDDDLYHPDRIHLQMLALLHHRAAACSLLRHQIYWTSSQRMCFSRERWWEGSLLCWKDDLPPYPSLRKGEDWVVVERLFREKRCVQLDHPELYTYLFHGRNTFEEQHFEEHWAWASQRFSGDAFARQLRLTARPLPPLVRRFLYRSARSGPRKVAR